MDMYGFMYAWNINFPNLIPLQDEFKEVFKHRWLRIHNFGVYQRYPRSEQEEAQVLERQNTVLNDLCETDKISTIIVSGGSEPGFPNGFEQLLDLSDFVQLESIPLHDLRPHEYEGAVDPVHFIHWAVRQSEWKWGMMNEVLLRIAYGKLHSCFFICQSNQILICPYEGGMDLIFPDTYMRKIYQEKYASWVSKHPSGL